MRFGSFAAWRDPILGDLNRFQVRYLELHRALLLDGVSFGLFDSFPERDFLTVSQRLANEGDSFVRMALPTLGRAFDRALVSGTFQCPEQFRRKNRTRLPLLWFTVFDRVLDSDSGTLRPQPCVRSIQYLRQILLLDSKIDYPSTVVQQETALRTFADCQARMRALKLDVSHPVMERARDLISHVLGRQPLDTHHLVPKHGPGGVAEGKTNTEKWHFDSWPRSLEPVFPFLMYGKPNIRLDPKHSGIPLTRSVTKVCLVPKDSRGPRLISAEPAAMQYVQQGLWREMETRFQRSSLFSSSVALRDQGKNREHCLRAHDQGFATLDLSNASDTISCQLIWFLFGGIRDWRRALFHARSTHARLPTGEEIRLYSFAPMGSAVCFPIETIVFWSIAVSCVSWFERIGYSSACRLVSVFGDDIIVPVDSASFVLDILRMIGCEPSPSKCCYMTPFRESCGIETFNGIDVSITRNKQYLYGEALHIEQFPSLLSYNQSLYASGYKEASRFFLTLLRRLTPTASVDERCSSSFLACGPYSKGGLKTRWNDKLHRFEAYVPVPRQRSENWECPQDRLMASLVGARTSDRMALRGGNTRLAWKSFDYFPKGRIVV